MMPPKKLGFSRRQMVHWFSPGLLIGRLFRRVSREFATRPDQPAPPPTGFFDYSQEPEIWLDFVAETGDGWDSTYTIASLLAQPQLEIEDSVLKRGRVLLLGGDTVHPIASTENYNDRLVGPFKAALPVAEEAQATDIFALPGDRDRTDGLKLFREQFCDAGTVGGWQTQQTGTYFALKLPHDCWLWGVDVARSDGDQTQTDYFSDVAGKLEAGDRVILASAELSWLGSQAAGRPFQSLDSFERLIRERGGIVALSLAGGRHHYVHYRAEDGEDPKFLAGGGGAFVRETHNLPQDLELSVRCGNGERTTARYYRETTFPDPDASRSLMWRNLLLPLKNLDLAFLIGLFYATCAWIASAGDGWFNESIRRSNLVGHPLSYLMATLLLVILIAFVEPNQSHRPSIRRKIRGMLGAAHTFCHLSLAAMVVAAVASLNRALLTDNRMDSLATNDMPWARLLFTMEGLVVGGTVGGFLFGLYLVLTNRLLGCHQSSASSTLRCPGYKGFLRLQINASQITVYPVGVEQVNRIWRRRTVTDTQPGESWFLPPQGSLSSVAHFIEKPIEIEPVTNSKRSGEMPTVPSARPWQIEDPPTGLLAALAAGECVLFAGSGLAAQAGLPTWHGLISGLISTGTEKGHIDPKDRESLQISLEDGRGEAVANELLHLLPESLLESYLESKFARQRLSEAHKLLSEIPFAGAMTTGFDSLLSKTFRARKPRLLMPGDAGKLTEALRNKRFFSLALYGSVGRSSLLFTERHFREALAKNRILAQFMETVFRRYTLLFLGIGLRSIRSFLESLQLASGERPDRHHFALVGETDDFDPVEARYLEREYRIHVLSFRPQERYPELAEFLKRLRTKTTDSDIVHQRRERPVLKRVKLINIGPFTRLTVKITPGWNVLLGDNGVGKTIVLRSIAAALCAEAADAEAVKRLLKSDADWGMIEIEAGGRSYTVELKRDSDREVEIVSTSLSPLRLDNWLVIGFPALRSVTWQRPKGPASENRPHLPSPEDVLPILVGAPDDRLNDLKQWLLNLDYVASAKGSEGRRVAVQRSRKLYRRFFEVLDHLTPGLDLHPHPIDRRTREVMIESNGRVVPLSAVSQGTASVICWVGTLLQRLYEVNLGEKDPEARGALVLVDELDAHMHPGWQRLLTIRLAELFPTVQMIATTHSPLIVGSLKPDEIQLVRRAPLVARANGFLRVRKIGEKTEVWVEREGGGADSAIPYTLSSGVVLTAEDGQEVSYGDELTHTKVDIIAEPLPFDIRGWRADQILTGPLFNLQSARNPEVEAALSRYTELAAQDEHDEEESLELSRLARKLEVQLPTTAERQEARQAYEMIRELMAQRTREMDPADRRRMIDEVKVQLQESVTGSRRPM